MKRIIILMCILPAFMIAIASCQGISDDEKSIVVDSNYDVIQMYIDILQGRVNFHEGIYAGWPRPQYFQSEYISLADYLIKIGDGIAWEITAFAVVDMTGSGINDIVLSLIHPQIMERISLVLVYEDGVVYSNIFTRRNMSDIRIDGTYLRSISSHWSVAKLAFELGVFSSEEILLSLDYFDSPDNFDLFVEEQDNIEYTRWIPFLAETIAEDLLIAWRSNMRY